MHANPAMVIGSERLRRLMDYVGRVARTSVPVLITGETGCGKELIARAVHQNSLRCARPWVDLNCAAIPDHLLESELFGYEKGAFSGADTAKPGMFELAQGGTLFLDEIGEADMRTQVKLLRILDGAPYYRLGGTRKVTVDVRLVAATNADLEEAIRQGRFRRDLFHRLAAAHILVPPLRERPEDIDALAAHFLVEHGPELRLAAETLAVLRQYSWPGNVRELRNVIFRAALAADGPAILPRHLPPGLLALPPMAHHDDSLESMERDAIRDALRRTGGRQDKAAELLGISRRTLIRRLKVYRAEALAEPLAPPHLGELAACGAGSRDWEVM